MQVLSLHFKGKMGHFRKYYSNSSSLSFFIPPRTTIIGILAGLLGYERDTYYKDFSLDNCSISLKCQSPIKKINQKMNYLMIKSQNDFNGSKENHSQTSVELVIPQDIRNGWLDYEIFIYHKNDILLEKLKNITSSDGPVYFSKGISMALGTAFNLGWIEYGGIFEGVEMHDVKADICSIMNVSNVKEIVFENAQNNYFMIKERLPIEFDENRSLTDNGLKEFLIELNGKNVPVICRSFVKLDDERCIMWME